MLFFKTFYSKIALTLLTSFILVGSLIILLVHQLTTTYQNEISQKLHLDLAQHVIHDNPLLNDGAIDQKALKKTFHSMMILGPSFEFYVLDSKGNILTYSADPAKIKRQAVALEPIQRLLRGEGMLPIRGDDPRSTFRQKIFSVAPILQDGQLEGYLYIIIGGEIYDSVVALFKSSHIMTLGVSGLAITLTVTLLAVLLIFALLTRPLRRLSADINTFREQGFEHHDVDLTHWDSNTPDEIHRLGATFNAMASELKQQYEKVKTTDELRRELISYISHDLRTPLASLSGYLETWQLKHQDISEADSAALIEVAQKNSRRITRMVEQLFELAYLDGVDVPINPEPIAIAELAQDVLQKLSLKAGKQGVRLDVTPKDPALLVIGDIEKIERVLTNLVDNAIRHCAAGDTVTISITPARNDYCITVADTGQGIPSEDIPQIFDPLFRASNSAKSQRVHSGLGLAITRRILELHGKAITVTSELDQGTQFSFPLSAA